MTPLSRRAPAPPLGNSAAPHPAHHSGPGHHHPQPGSAAAPPATSDEAANLIDLLTQQRDLYAQLSEFSGQQRQIIDAGQTEQLLAVLSQRQGIVAQLTHINQQITPLRQRMTAISEAAPPAVRQTLRDLVDQVQQMLQAIIEDDEADRRTLEESKARVSRELTKVKTAPAAINSYKSNAYRPPTAGLPLRGAPRFTDARG